MFWAVVTGGCPRACHQCHQCISPVPLGHGPAGPGTVPTKRAGSFPGHRLPPSCQPPRPVPTPAVSPASTPGPRCVRPPSLPPRVPYVPRSPNHPPAHPLHRSPLQRRLVPRMSPSPVTPLYGHTAAPHKGRGRQWPRARHRGLEPRVSRQGRALTKPPHCHAGPAPAGTQSPFHAALAPGRGDRCGEKAPPWPWRTCEHPGEAGAGGGGGDRAAHTRVQDQARGWEQDAMPRAPARPRRGAGAAQRPHSPTGLERTWEASDG